jgi:hypothetical protein
MFLFPFTAVWHPRRIFFDKSRMHYKSKYVFSVGLHSVLYHCLLFKILSLSLRLFQVNVSIGYNHNVVMCSVFVLLGLLLDPKVGYHI